MNKRADKRWLDFLQTRDRTALHLALDPEVVFKSPVMHRAILGRDAVAPYLVAAVDVLSAGEFRYIGQWENTQAVVLEFEAELYGVVINGVDIIYWNSDQTLITRFKVMIRPLQALEFLRRSISEHLERTAVVTAKV